MSKELEAAQALLEGHGWQVKRPPFSDPYEAMFRRNRDQNLHPRPSPRNRNMLGKRAICEVENMPSIQNEALPHLESYIRQLGRPETLEEAIAERDHWIESAAMFHKNEIYYTGLLDQIAFHLGMVAFTADDGSVYQEPVRAKLPDLVAALAIRS